LEGSETAQIFTDFSLISPYTHRLTRWLIFSTLKTSPTSFTFGRYPLAREYAQGLGRAKMTVNQQG